MDIIQVLIQQQDFQSARKYWNKLKERLEKEGNQSVTKCHQPKLLADDGKMRFTDAELIFTALAGLLTRQIAESDKSNLI